MIHPIHTGRGPCRFGVVILSIAVLFASVSSLADSRNESLRFAAWHQSQAPVLQIDNDLFAVSNRDRDYTGGLSLSLPRREAPRAWHPDHWLGPIARARPDATVLRSLQFQVLAFTPGELTEVRAQQADRPYASLWAVSGARERIEPDGEHALFASLTVGALGLRATEAGHRALHRAARTELPEGYDHQISSGGEPTAKLTVAHRRLLVGGEAGRGADVWTSIAASAGYLTEASVALATRWGDLSSPWWAAAPELSDYAPAPDFGVLPFAAERSFEAGIRLRLRAYNAFLQGQFRPSDVRAGLADAEPVILTAWIGFTASSASGWRLSYRLHGQSPELRRGAGSRNHFWGSLTWTRRF